MMKRSPRTKSAKQLYMTDVGVSDFDFDKQSLAGLPLNGRHTGTRKLYYVLYCGREETCIEEYSSLQLLVRPLHPAEGLGELRMSTMLRIDRV